MPYHHLRSVTAWLLLCSAVLLAGCESTPPTAPVFEGDVSGTYTLRTVDGSELPVVFTETPEAVVELLEGAIILAQDGTFREMLTFRETPINGQEGELIELETQGTYSVTAEGDAVVFASAEGTWSAARSEGAITYIIWEMPFAFEL